LQPLERVFTSEHGTVLIATLMVVVLLGTLGAALALAVSTESVTAANYEASQQTLYAADAGIERIVGEGSVDLSVQEPPKLALVG